jgi:hypothetical protein
MVGKSVGDSEGVDVVIAWLLVQADRKIVKIPKINHLAIIQTAPLTTEQLPLSHIIVFLFSFVRSQYFARMNRRM